ncbi:MAG: hypothetical protein DRQ47_00320 [Gammaproteobacteria bacterium]|nr:MAG: hypothetical protein DRQ47_00320 [Gammaproteobacteria bacterium]
MKLATTTSVLKRESVNSSLSGAVSSAEAGLDAATILIAGILETDFIKLEVADYYSPKTLGASATLYLTHMFVSTEDEVEVSYGTYSGDVTEDSYTVLDPVNYSVNYESGLVSLDNMPVTGKMSLKVSYLSGFSGETDRAIPSWLAEAAISGATYVMHTQVAAHGKQDILDISPEYRRMLYVMIQQHIRPRMNCMFSETSFSES